ncbi:MAG TPA: hypothetical protein VK307_04785 [Thermoleophilaceae bacterium]|nr:hypothetical protein [Thermoleophilaceae bacterium]
MYDWLLFFHLLAAFMLAVTVVIYSAVAIGVTAPGRTLFVADRCWDVGGVGTLILGIWLALHLDEYGFFDGWILGAIALWFVATGLGQTIQRRMAAGETAAVATMHWLRTLVIIGLLVLMIWKPGA